MGVYVCVGGIGACMLVCVWYTELTCLTYCTSKTDIVGQVLGPSVCVCLCVGIGACMLVCVWYTELTCIPYWNSRTQFNGHCGSGPRP